MAFQLLNELSESTLPFQMSELWAETPTKKSGPCILLKTVPVGKFDFPSIFLMKRTLKLAVLYLNRIYEGGKSQTKEGKHIKWYYWAWKHRNMVLSKKVGRR